MSLRKVPDIEIVIFICLGHNFLCLVDFLQLISDTLNSSRNQHPVANENRRGLAV